jgi:transcription antitermination factor NusG
MQIPLLNQQLSQCWYAVYVRPRHEKCVAAHFGVNSVEYFLPTYKTVHKWKNGCRMQLELPLFPGYLFARIFLSQRLCVLKCPGVVRFVGFNHDLSPVEDREVESLRLGLQTCFARPHPYLAAGTTIRVRRGPFEGRTGTLVQEPGRIRVILSMDLLKRAIAVELDLADLDEMPAAAAQEMDNAYSPQ